MEKLVILHTNDLHSHFEQMPKIASYIKHKKEIIGQDGLLVLDIGDHMDRMRFETDGSGGISNVDVMNETGYEAAVLGNNEGLTFTPADLKDCYANRANFPVIGSNIIDRSTGQIPDWMIPYSIIHKKKLRIGLIGVTAAFQEFYRELGWDVTDPLASIEHWVRELRSQVDLLIVMSHLGLRLDEQMANEINGIDLVLGGHTHHVFAEPYVVGNTCLCAAGKFGQYVGEVEIDYTEESSICTIKNISGRLIESEHLPDDLSVKHLVADHAVMARKNLSQEIAYLDRRLEINWYGESQLGNLVAAGLKRWTGAEIGLVNAGQMLKGLESGSVTQEMLLEICPGPINPCRCLLRGEDLRQAIEESLLPDIAGKRIRGYGFRGEVLGTLCVEGLIVEFDPSRPPMHRATGIWVNRERLSDDREYRVGMIDMFTFGVGYLSLSKSRSTQYLLPEFLRDVLRVQLQDKGEIAAAASVRWKCNTHEQG